MRSSIPAHSHIQIQMKKEEKGEFGNEKKRKKKRKEKRKRDREICVKFTRVLPFKFSFPFLNQIPSPITRHNYIFLIFFLKMPLSEYEYKYINV